MSHPTPTDPPACVHSLGAAELFLLTCLRGWVASYLRTQPAGPDWRRGFAMGGLGAPAARAFDGFLGLVARHAGCQIDVRDPTCTCLSADERRFLTLVAIAQDDDTDRLDEALSMWLGPICRQYGQKPLFQLARALSDRHLNVRARTFCEPTGILETALTGGETVH